MKTQGFLDQLLKTAQQSLGSGSSGGLGGLLGGAQASGHGKKPLLNADFGKGALAGGALGLLLGNKKVRKMGGKMGGKVAVYGGLAAVGMLAYKAYGDWKKQQDGAGTPAAPATGPATGPLHTLPAIELEAHSQAILRALVAGAKADGHIDARERELIEGEFTRIADEDPELRKWLGAELEKPLDPAEVARAAATPEMAAEMYIATLLAVDEQNFMERAYLDELARQLKIDDALKARLEQQVRDAEAS